MKMFAATVAVSLGFLAAYLALPQTRWIPKSLLLAGVMEQPEGAWPQDTEGAFNRRLWSASDSTEPVSLRSARIAMEKSDLTSEEAAILSRVSMSTPLVNLAYSRPSGTEFSVARANYVAASVLHLDEIGHKSDPSNAFWYLQDVFAMLGQHRENQAFTALEQASHCARYSNFSWAEADRKSRWYAEIVGKDSSILALDAAAGVLLPDMSQVKSTLAVTLSRCASDARPKIRSEWLRIGLLMVTQSETIIGRLVGRTVLMTAVSEVRPEWSAGKVVNKELARLSASELKKLPDQDNLKKSLSIVNVPIDKFMVQNNDLPSAIDPSLLPQRSWDGLAGWWIGMLVALFVGLSATFKPASNVRAAAPVLLIVPICLVLFPVNLEALGFAGVLALILFLLCSRSLKWYGLVAALGTGLTLVVLLTSPVQALGVLALLLGVVFLAWASVKVQKNSTLVWLQAVLSVLLFVGVFVGTLTVVHKIGPTSAAAVVASGAASLFGAAAIASLNPKTWSVSAVVSLVLGIAVLSTHTLAVLRDEHSLAKSLDTMKHETEPIDAVVKAAMSESPSKT